MLYNRLKNIYNLLYARFGPQHWWPGDTPFEIIIGAILTQNTNWANVEKAITNLKKAKVLSPEKLLRLGSKKLAELIRPAGYYNIKAVRLKNFLIWLSENYAGKLRNLSKVSTDRLRLELLSIKGTGPETADSILLYALNRPIFVVDAYTARICSRHYLIEEGTDYHRIQDLFESNLPADVKLFNEYHALLVRLGKDFCRPTPRCDGCPLCQLPHRS
jgi:endonuclease-3 related protein